MKPIHIDMVLKRGIWLRGRITDRVTGKPVEARLRYATSLNNPHIDEVPGLRDLFYNGNERGSYYTRDDGSYQIPVLTGPGLVSVHAQDPNMNYSADDQDGSKA